MTISKLQGSVAFSSIAIFLLIWGLLSSDSSFKTQQKNKQPSVLLQKAQGLPASSMVIIQKFDSLRGIIETKLATAK